MDYVLGGVAALITGNVTPNRPRRLKRALTPTKHQPSPNVTPKSEFVDDRSIFLSPTLQKKKAIIKKSPKRIFQNTDPDVTTNDDSTLVSPKAEKVKKHLKNELDADASSSLKSKNKNDIVSTSPKKYKLHEVVNIQNSNESTLKKKKKNKRNSHSDNNLENNFLSETIQKDSIKGTDSNTGKSPKKKHKSLFDKNSNEEISAQTLDSSKEICDNRSDNQQINQETVSQSPKKKKNKKQKNKSKALLNDEDKTEEIEKPMDTNENKENQLSIDKDVNPDDKKVNNIKQKNKGNKNKLTEDMEIETTNENKVNNSETGSSDNIQEKNKKTVKTKNKSKKIAKVNPNAITNKDSDSEHESDNEIESENEEINKQVLENDHVDSPSEDEETKQTENKVEKAKEIRENDPNEIKRTLFVGNVPFSKKCKKEIKRIFNKYGRIETVRIRTVPIKDVRDTPKMAVIKNELHPERTTVNVYIKFTDVESVEKALVENNTVLNDYHLRVTRSDNTGSEHDPHCSVFVGNLPFALEDEALRAKFEKCGEIESVRIIRDKKTNAGKGFGYVNFKSKDGVELALALPEEDLTIKNRILRVKRCTQNPQKQGGNRFKPSGNRFRPHDRQTNYQGGRQVGQNRNENDGAYRRVMNKRKYQEGGGEGPPNKRQNTNQPHKEKKTRKEFVGMTAEKKKKHKFDKGQKKKKMLSEILTK